LQILFSSDDSTSKPEFERLLLLLAFALPFAVYVSTLCPGVYLVDSGEFSTNLYTLGICHPTGYPTYTMLGYLWTHALPFGSVAMRVNFLSAVFGSVACGLMFILARRLGLGLVSSLICAAFAAFMPEFWSVATVAEVWTMAAALLVANLLLLVKFREKPEPRKLYALAFMCGLSLTHHMLTALFLPAIVLYAYSVGRQCFTDRKVFVKSVALGGAGLLPYLYLPIRSAMDPIINWGQPDSIPRFVYHITGRQFKGLMFSDPPSVVWRHFVQYLDLLNKQFTLNLGSTSVWLIWLVPLGAAVLFMRDRRYLYLLGAIGAINVFWGVNYHIVDINSYYIPSFLIAALCMGFGVKFILDRAGMMRLIVAGTCALIVVGSLSTNFSRMDRSNQDMVENYVRDLLRPLPRNSLVISCGDGVCSAIEYVQFVEGFRRDVKVIDRNILRGWYSGSRRWCNGWYLRTLDRVEPCVCEVYRCREWTKKEITREAPMRQVVAQNVGRRPVFYSCNAAAYRIPPRDHYLLAYLNRNYKLIPYGLVYRVVERQSEPDHVTVAASNDAAWGLIDCDGIMPADSYSDPFEAEIATRYATSKAVLGNCQMMRGLWRRAVTSYEDALRLDPSLTQARKGLAMAYFRLRMLDRATEQWRAVLAANPCDREATNGLTAVRAIKQISRTGL
jgi:hypothetical protein